MWIGLKTPGGLATKQHCSRTSTQEMAGTKTQVRTLGLQPILQRDTLYHSNLLLKLQSVYNAVIMPALLRRQTAPDQTKLPADPSNRLFKWFNRSTARVSDTHKGRSVSPRLYRLLFSPLPGHELESFFLKSFSLYMSPEAIGSFLDVIIPQLLDGLRVIGHPSATSKHSIAWQKGLS